MINNKTMIVVGAGASDEVGLPVGSELKKKIADILDIRFDKWHTKIIAGDKTVWAAVNTAIQRDGQNAKNNLSYQKVAWKIRNSMPLENSIDSFINKHQGDKQVELLGKLAIVKSILEEEKKSKLRIIQTDGLPGIDFVTIEPTWYNAFFKLLTDKCTVEQIEERLKSVSFIVFNYDRCIEHFLYHSLRTCYFISNERAAELVEGMDIFHPYGTVGNLPWYEGAHQIEFGADPNPQQLLNLANQIKTFTEGQDSASSDVVAIKQGMASADIVLFLGFAFDDQNLDLIQPPENLFSNDGFTKLYYGTAKGISSSGIPVVKAKLPKLNGSKQPKIELQDMKCAEFFEYYKYTLSIY